MAGHYHWVTAQNAGSPAQTSDPADGWLTPDDLAIRVLSVPSYGGEGDVLVRTEVSVNLQATFQNQSNQFLFQESATSQFIGDVGIHDGETIDPRGDGAYEFGFTWDGQWTWAADPANNGVLAEPYYMRCTSHGYITSKARRGPETYGAISPAFNLSVYTWGSEYYRNGITGVSSFWVVTARCLWYTP